MRQRNALLLGTAVLGMASGMAKAADNPVLTYHGGNSRHGLYPVEGLTTDAAAKLHPDSAFHASFTGKVYAQPLYWRPAGASVGLLIVVTEGNLILALNAETGATVWQAQLPASVELNDLPCGNVDPEGITGTPAIDASNGMIYLDALTRTSAGPRQMIYGVSASTGKIAPGWPIDIQAALAGMSIAFDSTTQGERSAVLLSKGNLYVTYGGRWGDCGTYHGAVVQVQASTHRMTGYWETRAKGGGIWAQGGAATDGDDLFITTGNTFDAKTWGDGEAIVRLKPGLAHSDNAADYFTPANWQDLDEDDADLGGTEALPLQVDNAPRLIAMGKDGKAYLINRNALGGEDGQIAAVKVSRRGIITAPAVLDTSNLALVAFTSYNGISCSGTNISMLSINVDRRNPISVKWCASFDGRGAPIITTSSSSLNPIVWVVGAEGDNRLHGFDAQSGSIIYAGGTGEAMHGLHHFQTLIAADHRLYVGADNTVYAFTYKR